MCHDSHRSFTRLPELTVQGRGQETAFPTLIASRPTVSLPKMLQIPTMGSKMAATSRGQTFIDVRGKTSRFGATNLADPEMPVEKAA